MQYVGPWTLRNGVEVNVRPIRPEDEPLMVDFHAGLSEHSVYMRYFHALKLSQRVAHDRLTRICFVDYDREMVLVAVRRQPERQIVGVGRLSKIYGTREAQFAILIKDDHQGQGLGSELLRRLLVGAREERGLDRVVAHILPENVGMKRVAEKLGFSLRLEDQVLKAELDLETVKPETLVGAGA